MSYNSNKTYGNNSISYSFSSSSSGFSEYRPTSNQMEYSNKTVISYSGNSNTNYSTPLFSNNGGSGNGLGNNRNYIGNASRKGMGMGKGGGRGAGKGGGKGIGSGGSERGRRMSKGGGGGMRNKGQACINMPNQFRTGQKNNSQLDEADLAFNKIEQSDSDIKTQKNPLDIIIEKLEEKSKREQKKHHDKILKEKE